MTRSYSYDDLKAWDHASLWHPFTQMQDWLAEDPIVIIKGEGNYTHRRARASLSGWRVLALVQCARP
jgi:adenosylmethionine-8-amino-7-oxononanoate aminotransferase